MRRDVGSARTPTLSSMECGASEGETAGDDLKSQSCHVQSLMYQVQVYPISGGKPAKDIGW